MLLSPLYAQLYLQLSHLILYLKVVIYYIKLYTGLFVDFQHKAKMYLHYDKTNKRWLSVKGGFIIAVGTLDEVLMRSILYMKDIRDFEISVNRSLSYA